MLSNIMKFPLTFYESLDLCMLKVFIYKRANTSFLPSFILQSGYGKDRLLFGNQHSRLDLNLSLKHKEDIIVLTVLFYINVELLWNTVISSK